MNEFTELLENFWIVRDKDSESYFRIKRAVNNTKMKRFLNQFAGWNIVVNNRLIKIEKIPAQAMPFMGIQSFQDKKDYCILCALLIFLEDKFEGEQFLFTEMEQSVSAILGNSISFDSKKFSDRKAIVRVLKFAESMSFIKTSDGSVENLESDLNKQILYENTGSSRYFSVNYSMETGDFQSYRDFEEREELYTDSETGSARINRVYRKLLLQPAVYWENKNDADSIYIRKQRRSIIQHLEEYAEGRLDIHNGAAFYMLNENDTFGEIHISDKAISGFCALICTDMQEILSPNPETHKTLIQKEEFHQFILKCKNKYKDGIGKQLRESSDERIKDMVIQYLYNWQFIEKADNGYYICDGVYKISGRFPEDYMPKV